MAGGVPFPDTRRSAIVIGLGGIAAAAAARLLTEQVVLGVLPFLFTFPATIAATLLGGALAGWITLGGCQLLTLAFVMPHWLRDSGDRPQELLNLVLATVSLAVAVWALSAFRRLQYERRGQCERELATLSLLVGEIDHRTKNNFQIAASLLHSQGLQAEPAVRDELEAAANRLMSIAAIYANLSARETSGGAIQLQAHLAAICDGLRAGLLRPELRLVLEGDELRVPANTALTIGLVVNEWVTNAIKYAFPDRDGTVRVRIAGSGGRIEVEVRDDGIGLPADRPVGTGSRLLASLIEALGAVAEVRGGDGTRCLLHVPVGATR